ncbi:Pentatricopeptide repeat-containing-like protein [Theobroma cacao]|uniref:Pentatricopeptide repeat-containing-like protein n=1 Tax=Theobroma cacao TaxID=3641 RepID=A0A061DLD7_THECC|nr:Pentatricopeptide repeat-containing-like protein [Theobroma cacao]
MSVHHVAWIPSSDDSWRLNFAGCIGPDGGGSGCVLRDQNGIFKAAYATPLKDCRSLIMAELIALHRGFIIAIKYGVDYIEIEGNQSTVIRMLVRQIFEYSNEAANNIARISTELDEPSLWDDYPPVEITNILVTDIILLFLTIFSYVFQQTTWLFFVKILLIVEARGFEPNIVMLNVLINAFGIAGRHEEALSIYHHIRECEPFMLCMDMGYFFSNFDFLIVLKGISPNVIAYSTVMKAFIRAKKFDKVLTIIEVSEVT